MHVLALFARHTISMSLQQSGSAPCWLTPLTCSLANAAAIEELRRAADNYESIATSDLPQYAHLEEGERNSVVKEAEAARSWLNEKLALQAQVGQRT